MGTLDGRPANIPSMHKKTLATTWDPDLSIMTTTQYMREHEEVMWIKKPKLRADYIKYKNNFKKYVERSAQFKPCLDNDITLNRVILNKVKKGCSFFYKCLSYHKRKDINWNKQRSYWENIFDKTYEDAEWLQIVNSLRDIRNNNYHTEHQLRILRNNIFTNKRLAFIVPGKTKYCDHCTDKIEDIIHHVYEWPKSQHVWRILVVILNQAGHTIYIDAEHAIFGFPDQNPNNPVNTMILFVKRFLYSCKFSGINPNINILLKQIKDVCKIQLIKNTELSTEFPGWNRLDSYLSNVWPASVYEELGTFGRKKVTSTYAPPCLKKNL